MRRASLVLALLAGWVVTELWILLRLGAAIGPLATIGLLAASAAIGALVGRAQGLTVFRRWLDATADGYVPEEGLVDGLLVLLGSALLIVPGVLGDVVGLLLLVPPLRRAVAGRIRRRAAGWVRSGDVEILSVEESFAPREDNPPPGDVIDVHGEVIEERPARLLGP